MLFCEKGIQVSKRVDAWMILADKTHIAETEYPLALNSRNKMGKDALSEIDLTRLELGVEVLHVELNCGQPHVRRMLLHISHYRRKNKHDRCVWTRKFEIAFGCLGRERKLFALQQ